MRKQWGSVLTLNVHVKKNGHDKNGSNTAFLDMHVILAHGLGGGIGDPTCLAHHNKMI